MTSSTASFVAVNRESDDSDSDTQTEPLPYAKGAANVICDHSIFSQRVYLLFFAGTSAIPFQREGQCTLANIESLSDETLEDLMAQITLTLNRRRINPNSVLFPSTTHQYSKSSPARLPKSKDKAQVASEHNDKKLHKRPKVRGSVFIVRLLFNDKKQAVGSCTRAAHSWHAKTVRRRVCGSGSCKHHIWPMFE